MLVGCAHDDGSCQALPWTRDDGSVRRRGGSSYLVISATPRLDMV